jgi:excinuclease ABC subunit A
MPAMFTRRTFATLAGAAAMVLGNLDTHPDAHRVVGGVARAGTQHCHQCNAAVGRRSQDEIVDAVLKLGDGTKLLVLSPKIGDRKGEHIDVLDRAKKAGFARVRIDGKEIALDQPLPPLNKKVKHRIDLVVDRLILKDGIKERLSDSVETALREGEGKMMVAVLGSEAQELFFSEHNYCHTCDLSFPDLEPNSFSFNSITGACPACNGLGGTSQVDLGKLIDNDLSINDGAIRVWGALGDDERQAFSPMLAILSARHETQYSRLFRS